MALYLAIILAHFLAGLSLVRMARRNGLKNVFRQSLDNPTPAMTAVWFVILLTLIVAAISIETSSIAAVAIYNGILPTAPEAFDTHPIQVMGHRAYLSDFWDLLFSGMWRTAVGSIIGGFAVLCVYRVLEDREKERRHDARIEWMKSRPE
jgi:hypothetical protein